MAEFEELRITVKAPEAEEAKKAIEATKAGFKEIATGPHIDGMKSIGREIGQLEGSVKALIASAGSGDAFRAISSLGSVFGKAGTVGIAITGVAELINAAVQFASNQARSMMTLADQARRVGIHPAQLQKEIEQARMATPEISAERMMSIVQHLHEQMVNIGTLQLPEAREKLMQFDRDPAVRALKMDLINQMIVAPQSEQLNMVVEGAQKLIKYYAEQGFPPSVGQLKAEEWARDLTGSIDILRVNDKFAQVSEEDKALMDQMVESSKAWHTMMAGMTNDFESIVRLIGVNLMNDPVFGGIVKFLGAATRADRELLEEAMLGKQTEMPWWFGPKLKPNVAGRSVAPGFPGVPGGFAGYIKWLYRTYQILREQPQGEGGISQHLLDMPQGMLEKQTDETQELVAQFRRLNALLAGEEKPIQRLPIHNQPMGGAAGESNPLTLAPGTTQPGGGAATEARNDLDESEFKRKFKGGVFAEHYQTVVNAAHANNIPPSLVASILGFETGWGKSRAVREYNNPAGLMAGGRGNRNFMKFETLEEGIAKAAEVQARIYQRGGGTIAGMGAIYAPPGAANDPNKTNAQWPAAVTRFQSQLQTYTGPEEGQGKGLRLDKEVAQRLGAMQLPDRPGSTPASGFFPEGRASEAFTNWWQGAEGSPNAIDLTRSFPGVQVRTRMPAFQNKPLGLDGATPTDLDPEGKSFGVDWAKDINESLERTKLQAATEAREREAVAAKFGGDVQPWRIPRNVGEAPESIEAALAGEFIQRPLPPDEPDLPAMQDFQPGQEPTDRANLDRGLGREGKVDASGDLDVSVKAPPGTEVKAEGDGMFKDNVSLDRQMQKPLAL